MGDDSQISENDEQDKMFFVNGFSMYQSVAPIYYAPSVGYPYVMNPVMNTVCTLQPGVMMPTMPVLQQPMYPNPNVPVYAPQQPFPRPPQQPRPPVPNPNYRPPNQGPNQQPNQRPIQRPNQYPNQGPQQPQR